MLLEIKRTADKPWWWDHINPESLGCDLVHRPIVSREGRPSGVVSKGFVTLVLGCVKALQDARRMGCEYIFTIECDLTSFILAGLQTGLRLRRPRHVILQFIMREKTPALHSRLKYAFMKWCLSSVDSFICSSRRECRYYADTFGWADGRFRFLTLLTDPAHLAYGGKGEEPFFVAAGRTFRDYDTLLKAWDGLDTKLSIVSSRGSFDGRRLPPNVTIAYDLPLFELSELMSRSTAVVLPLEDRQISTGQSVMFQAMAMGKAVIASRVSGTEDYIDHMRTGILVPPNDVDALRSAIRSVAQDATLRERLGKAARAQVEATHMPVHYARGVQRVTMVSRNRL